MKTVHSGKLHDELAYLSVQSSQGSICVSTFHQMSSFNGKTPKYNASMTSVVAKNIQLLH